MNARGSSASDYARYAEYETNLDSLRRKRSKRMGVKLVTYTGQRRVFFILDRATRKFHGDTALWLQYVTFARRQKANKKVTQIITNMLRLHPTSPELWAYAADYALDERGDVTEARSYMQRGLRLCSSSKYLWSEYLKLEMIYIAKILMRRQILGLDASSPTTSQALEIESTDADLITLPTIAIEDASVQRSTANESQSKIISTPALSGAIPIAIFDAAFRKFPSDAAFAANMFSTVAEFHQLKCTRKILQHITEALMISAPTDVATLKCWTSEPIIGLGASSTELPAALIQVLDRFDSSMQKLTSLDEPPERSRTRASVSQHMIQWILPYLDVPELDSDIRAVLITMVKTAWKQCSFDIEAKTGDAGGEITALLENLHHHRFQDLVRSGLGSALKIRPDEPRLLALEESTTLSGG